VAQILLECFVDLNSKFPELLATRLHSNGQNDQILVFLPGTTSSRSSEIKLQERVIETCNGSHDCLHCSFHLAGSFGFSLSQKSHLPFFFLIFIQSSTLKGSRAPIIDRSLTSQSLEQVAHEELFKYALVQDDDDLELLAANFSKSSVFYLLSSVDNHHTNAIPARQGLLQYLDGCAARNVEHTVQYAQPITMQAVDVSDMVTWSSTSLR
jgi:hypothetical protein